MAFIRFHSIEILDLYAIGCYATRQFLVSLWDSRELKKPKKSFDNIFHVDLMRGFQKYAINVINTLGPGIQMTDSVFRFSTDFNEIVKMY